MRVVGLDFGLDFGLLTTLIIFGASYCLISWWWTVALIKQNACIWFSC